ncbi:MAG: hypothetical protein ACI8WY_003162, partial [Planctomycetota bacterium]
VRSIADTSHGGGTPLITTDGFKFYAPTIRHVFGVGCVLAQVIRKIRRSRVVRVGTKLVVGTEWRLSDALRESEDSTKLNTALIERPEPHDPSGLRLPASPIAVPRSEEADTRRSPGALPLLLQIRAAAQRAGVREDDTDAGDAGGARDEAAHLSGHLHGALRRGPCCRCQIPGGGVSRTSRGSQVRRVATTDDGSTTLRKGAGWRSFKDEACAACQRRVEVVAGASLKRRADHARRAGCCGGECLPEMDPPGIENTTSTTRLEDLSVQGSFRLGTMVERSPCFVNSVTRFNLSPRLTWPFSAR